MDKSPQRLLAEVQLHIDGTEQTPDESVEGRRLDDDAAGQSRLDLLHQLGVRGKRERLEGLAVPPLDLAPGRRLILRVGAERTQPPRQEEEKSRRSSAPHAHLLGAGL